VVRCCDPGYSRQWHLQQCLHFLQFLHHLRPLPVQLVLHCLLLPP
jgi:hypothetical protein